MVHLGSARLTESKQLEVCQLLKGRFWREAVIRRPPERQYYSSRANCLG